MSKAKIGKIAPAFNLPATGEQKIRLSALKGSNVVVYFYPRDATPGCTTESQDFRDAKKAFDKANTIILGISQDPMKSHEKFLGRHLYKVRGAETEENVRQRVHGHRALNISH